MKTLVCLLVLVFGYLNQDRHILNVANAFTNINSPSYILTLQEAQSILGEPCHIKESSDSTKEGVHEYKSSYEANAIDAATNKVGMLYYMYEDYKSEAAAKKTYKDIKESNQKSQGFEIMTQFGDEAYFHSDNRNFHFILARKGNKMIRLKVNKVTSKTSVEGLKSVAKGVLGRV